MWDLMELDHKTNHQAYTCPPVHGRVAVFFDIQQQILVTFLLLRVTCSMMHYLTNCTQLPAVT
jgi:hypothetical protein